MDYGVCRQAVKTSDCGSDMHGFESHQTPHLKFELLKEALFSIYGSFQGSIECGYPNVIQVFYNLCILAYAKGFAGSIRLDFLSDCK